MDNRENICQIVGERIRAERTRQRLSQEKLALMVGVSSVHLGMIERGKGNPSINTLVKIARGLDVELSVLF